MLEDVKFDLRTIDFRALTPDQWTTLKNRLIEQALERRNAELRATAGKVFAGPEQLLRIVLRALARAQRAIFSAVHRADGGRRR
jgi:hypothetical protein